MLRLLGTALLANHWSMAANPHLFLVLGTAAESKQIL